MLRLIAHRGNVFGKDEICENQPEYISCALECGWDVEIDAWLKDDELFLGHDFPLYRTTLDFIKQKGLWVHAKNKEIIPILAANKSDINWFWHENDQYTLTSFGYIWAFPGNFIDGCVVIQPEPYEEFWKNPNRFFGICTDKPEKMKNSLLFSIT